MKVFVAGATGALGKQLVPMLVEKGHEVTGMTRSALESFTCWEARAKPTRTRAASHETTERWPSTAQVPLRSTSSSLLERSASSTREVRSSSTKPSPSSSSEATSRSSPRSSSKTDRNVLIRRR